MASQATIATVSKIIEHSLQKAAMREYHQNVIILVGEREPSIYGVQTLYDNIPITSYTREDYNKDRIMNLAFEWSEKFGARIGFVLDNRYVEYYK